MSKSKPPVEFLHVYGQYLWHGEAVIRGTREALVLVRKAIDDALEGGEGYADLLATDGEGYQLVVVKSSTIAGVGQPDYRITAEYSAAKREARLWEHRNQLSRGWEIEPTENTQ